MTPQASSSVNLRGLEMSIVVGKLLLARGTGLDDIGVAFDDIAQPAVVHGGTTSSECPGRDAAKRRQPMERKN